MKQFSVIDSIQSLAHRTHCIIAAAAGALVPLSFAPFKIWPAGILALTVLALLLREKSLKQVMQCTLSFGVGMYAMGISWIYVSISGFGGAPAPLAIFLVAVFSIFMAGFFSLPFYIFGRWLNQPSRFLPLAFASTWFISEWLRTWLLTGFPWLFIGYADLHNWLSGWAPLIGVMGLSFLSALTAGVIAELIVNKQQKIYSIFSCIAVICIWISGYFLQNIQWTTTATNPTSVAMVQPNIDQEKKWQEESRQTTLDLLREKSEPLWGTNIVIWPEAAVTELYSDALPYLNEMNRKAADSHTGLITGIIYDDATQNAYFNSMVALGDAIGIHHKKRLVPFGEYVPMEWLRNTIEFFNLPTSYITLGPEDQHNLKVNDLMISPAACYEVVFPDLIAASAKDTQLLVSVSNLGWFGDSLARHQFMEMAQMRALETQHYYVYSTNNGPSAIFDTKGHITAESKAFTQDVLAGNIYAVTGNTPFINWGSTPLVILCGLLIMVIGIWNKQNPS